MTAHTESNSAAEVFALRLILDHLKMTADVTPTDAREIDDLPDLWLVIHELAVIAGAALIVGAKDRATAVEWAIGQIEDTLGEVLGRG